LLAPGRRGYIPAVQITTVPAEGGPLEEIAAFVATRNDDDAQHIGYVGTKADDIAATFRDLYPGALFALARDGDGALVGVLGAEWDLDIGRTWLYGPWGRDADGMYDALRPHIPSRAAEHEVYPAVANSAVCAFAERHGFSGGTGSLTYVFTRDRLPAVPPTHLPEITTEHHAAFSALHDRVFPGTSSSAATLLERRPPPLVAVEDGRLLGYVVLRLTPDSGEGELDYLAVEESARGRGLGRTLVQAAVHQAFDDERMTSLELSTNADNETGQRLYESVGFVRGRPMRGFRTSA
jgi:GNAT superfamily N-acetyltransferase